MTRTPRRAIGNCRGATIQRMVPGRRPFPVAASIALIAGAFLGACAPAPRTGQELDRAADEALRHISVSLSADGVSLVATGAFADFGLNGGGAHQVRVRIVDRLELQLRLESDVELAFAEPPTLCLVGPYSAPDDAGLSEPCWGEPDLSGLFAAQLSNDPASHPLLRAGKPIEFSAPLNRGSTRCDYPAGQWVLELKADPLVDGSPAGARYAPDVRFDVALPDDRPLALLPTTETRYCGLATAVYREQGEPTVIEP